MACTARREEQIGDLVGGRMAAADFSELMAHVEGCEACSRELDLAATLVSVSSGGASAARAGRRPRLLPWVSLLAASVLVVLGIYWGGQPPGQGLEERLASLVSIEPVAVTEALLRSTGAARGAAWTAAMDAYRAGDFAAAAERLAPLHAARENDALAALYLGVSRLQIGAIDAAVAALQSAAEHGDGLLQERAWWYLANAALRSGDAQRALEILDRLVALKGDYELNARDKASAVRALLEQE